MPARVSVAPQMLTWARKRSGKTLDDLTRRFPKLPEWEAGELLPTMRQLEQFAQATYTPIGFLFLSEPPTETVPIPDFRTLDSEAPKAPSPNLLDTIYACEQRQDWYREFAEAGGEDEVALVGSASLSDDPREAAARLRGVLGFDLSRRREFTSWTDALSKLSEHVEDLGVLVMISGVVGTNTHRKLDPDEFRGFAIVDGVAPLVFVNGADTKAAQIFTLAHEIAHIALGGSALSNPDLRELQSSEATERWCNEVAAELLVPAVSIVAEFRRNENLTDELDRLARLYRVSTLVVLRRIHDAGLMSRARYRREYEQELARVLELLSRSSSGGDFYNTQPVRVSRKFARALISDTLEGRTLYRDAFRLLGFRKASTFDEWSQRLGAA